MSSSELGGASQRMPNQAKGYSRKYPPVDEPVTAARATLREPSAPTTNSASISNAAALGILREHPWAIGLGALDAERRDAEAQVLPARETRGDEIFQHLVLRVEPDAPAGEAREVDAVSLALEAQLDAVVAVPDGQNAVGGARRR